MIIDDNHSHIGQHRKSQDENINHKPPLVLYVNSSITSLEPGTSLSFRIKNFTLLNLPTL